jgi:hypothetical protein
VPSDPPSHNRANGGLPIVPTIGGRRPAGAANYHERGIERHTANPDPSMGWARTSGGSTRRRATSRCATASCSPMCRSSSTSSTGASLEPYLWTRIHGAVLDELRRRDWAPRSLRRLERDLIRAQETFTGAHGRAPTRAELASKVNLTLAELREKEYEIRRSDLTSLSSLAATGSDVHAARDRRGARGVGEPRLADPLAAEAADPRAAHGRQRTLRRARELVAGVVFRGRGPRGVHRRGSVDRLRAQAG